MRYHERVFFPADSNNKFKILCDKLNKMPWNYSKHCLRRVYEKFNCHTILRHISQIKLSPLQIFEYYTNDSGNIERIVCRLSYNNAWDIIVVVSAEKNIVTIYCNSTNDNHATLNAQLYAHK